MARAQCADDTPIDHDSEKPNHMILWLDAGIGNPKEYIHLKKAFAGNTDPRAERPMMLNDKDYEMILQTGDAVTVTFEGVTFLLQAFQNEEACLKAFEENQTKRIFFITSGKLGRTAVPTIIEQYRHVFTDSISNKPYPSIYVFCHNIQWQMDWAGDYLEYLQMFNFDSELLQRMTRDIADYFIERGARLRHEDNFEGAIQRLHWAKKLWYQYDKMTQQISTDDLTPVAPSQRSKDIDNLLDEVERLYGDQQQTRWAEQVNYNQSHPDDRHPNDDDDDTKCGQSSS